MELPKHTRLIDDLINNSNAMALLFDTYQSIEEKEEQEKFVLALVGHAVISHQLLQHQFTQNNKKRAYAPFDCLNSSIA